MADAPSPVFLRAFGLAVRERREQLAMSQEAFADHSGFHRTYVSGVERGRRNPSLVAVFRLAEGLGVTGSELLEQAQRHLDGTA